MGFACLGVGRSRDTRTSHATAGNACYEFETLVRQRGEKGRENKNSYFWWAQAAIPCIYCGRGYQGGRSPRWKAYLRAVVGMGASSVAILTLQDPFNGKTLHNSLLFAQRLLTACPVTILSLCPIPSIRGGTWIRMDDVARI